MKLALIQEFHQMLLDDEYRQMIVTEMTANGNILLAENFRLFSSWTNDVLSKLSKEKPNPQYIQRIASVLAGLDYFATKKDMDAETRSLIANNTITDKAVEEYIRTMGVKNNQEVYSKVQDELKNGQSQTAEQLLKTASDFFAKYQKQ